jgi:hypothetical protein
MWHVREGKGYYTALVGKPEKRDHLEDLDVNKTIILKSIFKDYDGDVVCTDLAENRKW